MTSFKAIKIFSVTFLLACIHLQSINAQSPSTENIEVQKVDFRGQRPQAALMAAVSASRQDVIVVVVEGGDDELIFETENNLKGLIRNGYTRLGLILCDPLPDATTAVVAIISSGLAYAVVQDAKADAKTSSDVYKLVRDAYQEDILSKLKPEAEPTKGGF